MTLKTGTFETERAYGELLPHFQERLKRDEPLARHSAFGVGGPADIWVTVGTKQELIQLVNMCAEEHWPLLVVGNGSNSLFADAGVRGIVARVGFSSYRIEQEGPESARLIADAGVGWPRLAYELTTQGWGGLSFGVGIPGTLGGALVSNAGAHNQEIGELVEWIEVLDARGADSEEEGFAPPLILRYQHDELDLSYRSSRLRARRLSSFDEAGQVQAALRRLIEPPEMVLQLELRLQRAEPGQLRTLLNSYRQQRRATEPLYPRRGSVFQDLPEEQASLLLAHVGMAGRTAGEGQMAIDNPNYLVNLGGARASDMAALIEEAHAGVLERFGLDLRLDVELLGEWKERGEQP